MPPVRHNADRLSAQAAEADHQVPGVMFVDLQEPAVVHHGVDDLLDVVRLVRVQGNHRVQRVFPPVVRVVGREEWRIFHVVGRQERQELPDQQQGVPVVIGGEVGHPGPGVVGHGAA